MVMNVSDALAAYKHTAQAGLSMGSKPQEVAGENFADTLKDFLGDAVESVKKSEQLAADGATGKANLQDVIMAVSEAEVNMQTIVALRDRVINAYQEIMRISV